MRTERRSTAAVCAALLAAGVLAACGADDEPASRNASATTARTATVLTTTVTTPATAATSADDGTIVDPTVASGASAAGATSGVGDLGSEAATGSSFGNSCANASGLPADNAAIAEVDAPTTTTTTTTTTPLTDSELLDGVTPNSTTTTPTPDLAATDQVNLERPFSTSSPWNTAVDTRPVDRRSAGWIARASRRVAVVAAEDQAGVRTTQRLAPKLELYVNTCAWTPAIVSKEGGETVRIVCRQRNCGPVAKEVTSLQVTPGIDPFPEFDGWYSVIDESSGIGYDMWRARRVGDVISYQFIKRWQLDGPGFSPPATTDPVAAVGARGSGLPLFAGIIQPGELRRGRIDHALAISVPGPAQRVFTPPASVTNGVNVLGSLPQGARLRLKSSFTQRRPPRGANRRSADAILTALRTYGAIVVDRSIAPTLYARRSSEYGPLLVGNELQNVRLADLEVVQANMLLRFPPLESTDEEIAG